jgi:hypothetical protein
MGWLKEIHSENGRLSSKRVYGAILIISAVISLFMKIDTDLAYAVLYIGAGLIGFGTTVELAKAFKGGGKATPPAPSGDVNIEIEQR